jgi:predicted CoA-binding protein
MTTIADATTDFLAQKRIAVAGVSRRPAGHGGNVVYKRLKDRGYAVFAVNPNADSIEGDPCYHDLASIPGGVDAVVIATAPDAAIDVARQAHELGITRVWMHRSFGGGSVSADATDFCRANGMTAIPGGCPLMYGPTSDTGHRCMRWFISLTGGIPKNV